MKINSKLNYLIISLLVISALLIVGSINLLIKQSLEEEIERKNLTISEYIAEDLINPLLNKDIIRVQEIIDNLKIKNADIRYAFVVNFDGIVIAHTFSDGFPVELVTANPIPSQENSAVQIISANKELIQDIGIRLLERMDAKVYIGFSRTPLLNSITKTNNMIITIVALILLFGIIANIILSRKITKPIEALVEGTKRISSGNYDFQVDVVGDDEIRELTASFNQMTTERKQAEERIEKIQSLRNAITDINQLLVRVKSESELFQQVCNFLIKVKEIKFVWIGLTNSENFEVKPVAQAGFEEDYLSSIKVTWDDSKYGNGPTGIALKTSQPFIMRNIEDDPKFKPWKNDALKRGYLSSIALPLIYEKETIGALNVYSGIKDAFTDEEVKFLKEVSEDITIGIRSLRLELKLQQSYKKLQKTAEGTINIVSKIVESRDPYTAGHQLNVSKITTAIAREMKLTEDKIEGIRIASLVHDIGKISIPAEILSKPIKLNEIEYKLIKDHSQIGYDILKTIDFPWPIAQIVLQHHERIDGSGYPQGLKGNQILLEARIIGVADVVEAMFSHRPYRPARGIDKALEEITQNKGILYDPEVVDACLKLFKKKEFKF